MKLILIIAFFVVNVTASGYAKNNQYDSGYAVQSANPPQSVDLLTAIRQNGFTTFVDLIVKAGLEETFSANRPFVILAPTNEAFAAIDPAILAALLKDIYLLRDILRYHLVLFRQPCSLVSSIFVELPVNTALGEEVRFNVYRNKGPSFATEDITTANGVPLLRAIPTGKSIIYPIEKVLNPQDVSPNNTVVHFLRSNKDFSIFLSVFEVVLGLANNNFKARPKTTFVPTNAAFKALPPGVLDSIFADPEKLVVLLHTHIASGTFYTAGLIDGPLTVFAGVQVDIDVTRYGITVGNAKIIEPDITVFEGVVQYPAQKAPAVTSEAGIVMALSLNALPIKDICKGIASKEVCEGICKVFGTIGTVAVVVAVVAVIAVAFLVWVCAKYKTQLKAGPIQITPKSENNKLE